MKPNGSLLCGRVLLVLLALAACTEPRSDAVLGNGGSSGATGGASGGGAAPPSGGTGGGSGTPAPAAGGAPAGPAVDARGDEAGNPSPDALAPTTYTLALTVSGGGRVTAEASAVDCTGNCTYPIMAKRALVLQAGGAAFDGWAGDCQGTGPCTVVMDRDRAVAAHFRPLVTWETMAPTSYHVALAGDAFYATARFSGTQDFSGVTKTSAGMNDQSLSKYDLSGKLLWVHALGGPKEDLETAVAVGPGGEVAVSGYTENGRFILDGTPVGGAIPSRNFLARFLPSGALVWAKDAPSNPMDIAFDNRGDLLVAGWQFGDNVVTLDGSGAAVLAKSFSHGIHAIRADRFDSIYVAGIVSGPLTVTGFPPATPKRMQPLDQRDTVFARFTVDGEALWATQVGAGKTAQQEGFTESRRIVIDEAGNLFAWGTFSGQLALPAQSNQPAIDSGAYLVKLAGSDGHVLWSKVFERCGNDSDAGLALDQRGDIVVGYCALGAGSAGRNITQFMRYANATGEPVTPASPPATWVAKEILDMSRHPEGDLFVSTFDSLARISLP